jgi:hypothetical protein
MRPSRPNQRTHGIDAAVRLFQYLFVFAAALLEGIRFSPKQKICRGTQAPSIESSRYPSETREITRRKPKKTRENPANPEKTQGTRADEGQILIAFRLLAALSLHRPLGFHTQIVWYWPQM